MKHGFARRLKGVSTSGLMVLVVILAVVGVLAARVVPSVIEYRAIQGAVERAGKEGDTPEQIRYLFDRSAQVEGVSSISGKDLDISKNDAGKVVVKYAYDRQFPLVGPAFLLIKYAGQSR